MLVVFPYSIGLHHCFCGTQRVVSSNRYNYMSETGRRSVKLFFNKMKTLNTTLSEHFQNLIEIRGNRNRFLKHTHIHAHFSDLVKALQYKAAGLH